MISPCFVRPDARKGYRHDEDKSVHEKRKIGSEILNWASFALEIVERKWMKTLRCSSERIQGNKEHKHSVESPSMVDPQWDIRYWGSKWNLHTDCWSVVGCEWGTTSVYFGITFVCFIPSRHPVVAVEPQYLLQDFLFLSKVSFEGHIQNLQKISCWF